MIELNQISKTFGDTKALSDINLFIQEGEIFGIIGKSGAGKSTLLRIINLLERPDSGDVTVDNVLISHAGEQALLQARHKIAMIFQQFNLLNSKTVFENIVLPLKIQKIPLMDIDEKIDELLSLVGLSDKKYAYPTALSGGEKQRVAIARALIVNPKVLLCDEATSALDPYNTEAILTLLKKVNQMYGITIVLITHDMSVVKQICHRLAVIERGCLIEVDSLSGVIGRKHSVARGLLFAKLMPKLPECLSSRLTQTVNHKPLLRLVFQGNAATVPFISQTSRELVMDINILLANMDRVDDITCGVLVVELDADPERLQMFISRCQQVGLTVEILGYVMDSHI